MASALIAFYGRHCYGLEHATTAWLMQKGMGFAVLSGQRRVGLAITGAQIRYVAPVHLEQTVQIRLALRDLTPRGFTTPFEIVRQADGVTAAFGHIRRRVMDLERHAGGEVPEDLYPRFQAMEAESRDMVLRQE